MYQQLPVPDFFDPAKVAKVYRVDYAAIATQAKMNARRQQIPLSAQDGTKVCLMCIDAQNTFCLPDFELYVGGRSGNGAVDDNVRLCEFIYKNLAHITQIAPTMDTHMVMQIFHPMFWVNENGETAPPMTMISVDDVRKGTWRVNPAITSSLTGNYMFLQRHAMHYVESLAKAGKYTLTVWPYHAMLGGVGHALVSAVEEAIFYHTAARASQPDFQIKGGNPLTENYSVLRPEVMDGPNGLSIGAQRNAKFIESLLKFDAVVIAGQAKSHCVAWTIDDLLNEINAQDPTLARKVYLLEDCTSPVVVPGIVDFTDEATAAFKRFADAGMHVVRSADPMNTWPGLNLH